MSVTGRRPRSRSGAAPAEQLGDRATAAPPRTNWLKEALVLAVLVLAIVYPVRTFVAQAFSIPSASMTPQLEVGDRVVVSKLAYRLHEPRRGDVLVFDDPALDPATQERPALLVRIGRGLLEAVGLRQPSTDEFIKRVIALPGETVEGRDGRVYVNGAPVVEPYLPAGATTSAFAPVKVPTDRLWVMGDNRSNSRDSRVFGAIRESDVVGRAFARVFPIRRIAYL